MIKPDWIAVDWGTTNLRVWAMRADGNVLDKRASDDGMQQLNQSEFEPALLSLIEDWLTRDALTQVICCGMVGARQGWIEADYRTAPCKALSCGAMAIAPTSDLRIQVHVLPGIKQPKPADVMRGEETQISGFISKNRNYHGVLCLPGTHTKWANVHNSEITKFTTFMTGELFSLLSEHSVLRHSVSSDGWNSSAFEQGVEKAIRCPATITANLFSLRAEALIGDLDAASAGAQLSGLLIGQEIGAMREVWQGQNLAILGADNLSQLYATALGHIGVKAICYEVEPLTLAGCAIAYNQLECAA